MVSLRTNYCICVTPYHIGKTIQFDVVATIKSKVEAAKKKFGETDHATRESFTFSSKEFVGLVENDLFVRNSVQSRGFLMGRIKIILGKTPYYSYSAPLPTPFQGTRVGRLVMRRIFGYLESKRITLSPRLGLRKKKPKINPQISAFGKKRA